MPYSTLPDSDGVPWILSRACSGEWPYRPDWKTYLSHPSVRNRYDKEGRMFVIPSLTDRSVLIGVEAVRREARQVLGDREVKHFEVLQVRHVGYRAVPHRLCSEEGCVRCQNLGVMFVPDETSYVDLFGWLAVVRVVA